jgi:hypothetical protein
MAGIKMKLSNLHGNRNVPLQLAVPGERPKIYKKEEDFSYHNKTILIQRTKST